MKLRDPETGLPTRSTTAMLVLMPVLAAVFTLAVGWERVWERFQINDPYLVRKEFMLAAVDMAEHRPLIGYGLGIVSRGSLGYAIKDFLFSANHTHTMTGLSFAARWWNSVSAAALFTWRVAVPTAVRNPWGLGLIAVMLHACGLLSASGRVGLDVFPAWRAL